MGSVDTSTEYAEFAAEVLERFQYVATDAEARLTHRLDPRTSVSNTFTSEAVLHELRSVFSQNEATYRSLTNEPAIARIVVSDETGARQTWYFCRLEQGLPPKVFSYLSPNGRLASLPVGSSFTLKNGTVVRVVERAQLHPQRTDDDWDSHETIIHADGTGPITLESLRDYLAHVGQAADVTDLLAVFIAREDAQSAVFKGIRRSVITKMALRDQPILDRFQDEIFRLPLSEQLIILGPPGTGKTTTLVRRLAQKRSGEIDEGDQALLQQAGASLGEHADSWLMFTPTELLSQYLKEALARENVPASSSRLRTWEQFRRDLGRNVFKILRSSDGAGSFRLNEQSQHLAPAAFAEAISWFEEFNIWHNSRFVEELRSSSRFLSAASDADTRSIALRLSMISKNATAPRVVTLIRQLAPEAAAIRKSIDRIDESVQASIDRAIRDQLAEDRSFLDGLAAFIAGLPSTIQGSEADESEDEESDDEPTTLPQQARRASPVTVYRQVVRARARASGAGRQIPRASKTGTILEWLGDRIPPDDELTILAASLSLRTHLRRFAQPLRYYFSGCARWYRTYRRRQISRGRWYVADGSGFSELHPLELDLLLLSLLRTAAELLNDSEIRSQIDNDEWSALKPIYQRQRNQVLVDEATDFSPVQLACMAAISHPTFRSFFACGDFNQRLTAWGTQSLDDLQWAIPGIRACHISVSYRQSAKLSEFAYKIAQLGGNAVMTPEPPEHVDIEGVCPALLEHQLGVHDISFWMAERIREIERFVGQLPSIAVFVTAEEEVEKTASSLASALSGDNIAVTACHDGQTVGDESNVRVFDVQHIKGLEFEAAFFVGVDRLALLHPDLFDKYLYVGATRAATYLGLTCFDALPANLQPLRPHFCTDWNT
jgi:ABC-type cobalamin/Fe3+-siderophores transport system ATPase subunit